MSEPNELMNKICRIQKNEETGTLRLGKNGEEISVFFSKGLISATSTNISNLQLGRFLSKRGHIADSALQLLLKESLRRRLPLGTAAVARKLLDVKVLEAMVCEQVIQTLLHAVTGNFLIRSFTSSSGDSFFMPARIDLRRLLLELARANIKPFSIEPDQRILLRGIAGLSGLPWRPQELTVMGELYRPRTIRELAEVTGLGHEHLDKILWVFYSLRLIEKVQNHSIETDSQQTDFSFPFENLTPEIPIAPLGEKLEVLRNSSSFISEQFKTLKIRIREAFAGKPSEVIVVTSACPEDGKSLISVNLGAAFSKDPGRRVIIVDCDMRNPSLHKFLGISPDPGLLGYLEGDAMKPYGYLRRCGNLFFLTAGGNASNPVELLSHEKMNKLIEQLRSRFDTIIIDSPPLTPISDAQILSSLCDGLLLVVRCGKTSYGSIERACRVMDRNKLIGMVLNDVRPMRFNTEYNHHYYNPKSRNVYPYAK
jgi:protein-tyrosine kinase